ncbi:MAG: Lrp/AsnC family transcriptional regulator [Meiothermus sp.]|uniref:Lrp/AsnC family transcriptional regulator n=1 Tax=Meiothermus sp. TaxID=1955249 RepID=UPI0025F8CF20|nr:Lrp/AsnC family transcriptional regulator [Meiothermus sp.]MCS7058502.1 Lrp/AsnC family transcriptional regulator [Meiothermus sp.]MCS7195101.1 Lrp/AsnC family transcriptional regulator [Meiothermus sp.]MCX7740253.1 Lrp/AsnC family transcriptional regulator [Meiothermus sp.]MDW8091033.1 Lrp/AsnC family transcriptional regulator [Meiothermus sp.]MDW8480922.1 Lrp/AsnC family transcriptional regulator [Meiothermus sp.]
MAVKLLDKINCTILLELQKNGRLSYSELGRRVGLSTPAVAERVRRLEDAGVLVGYRARVNPAALGYGVTALIEVATPPHRYEEMLEFAERTEAVRECYFVTGEASFVAKVVVPSVQDLQTLIQQMGRYGNTRTSVVLSQPVLKEVFEVVPTP